MDRPNTSHFGSRSRSFSMLRRPRTAIQISHDDESHQPNSFDDNVPNIPDWAATAPPVPRQGNQNHEQQELVNSVLIQGESANGVMLSDDGSAESGAKGGDKRPGNSRLSGIFRHRSRDSLKEAPGTAPPATKLSTSSNWFQRAASATFRVRRRSNVAEIANKRTAWAPPGQPPVSPHYGPNVPMRLRGGDAARAAAAAASSERIDAMSSSHPKEVARVREAGKSNDDNESGIGIELPEVTTPGSDLDLEATGSMARIDPAALPEELFHHILTFLDATSLMATELVSRRWHETAGSRSIWRDVFTNEFRRPAAAAAQRDAKSIPIGGRGIGDPTRADQDWKRMWQARKALDSRWRDGHAAGIYLEGHSDSVYCVQFDETKIITGSRDRTIRVWDLHTFECVRVLGVPKASTALATSPPPIGSRMHAQKQFATLTPMPAQCVSPIPSRASLNHHGSILCLQFDETTMVTGSSDMSLIIWDLTQDYLPVQRLSRHRAGVLDVCFDARHIVSCSKDTTICLWDRVTGNLLSRFTGHLGPVNAVQLRGEHFVSASGDGIAKLWHLASGLCVKEFPSKDRGLACVEFSPDGRTILAGGNDQVIYQFDANTGELVRELAGHGNLVRSLHLDAVNGRVISGSYDYSVKVFDLAGDDRLGEGRREEKGNGRMVCDFQGWTTSWMLSAMADYRRIVATSQDGRVVVMDFGYGLRNVELLEATDEARKEVQLDAKQDGGLPPACGDEPGWPSGSDGLWIRAPRGRDLGTGRRGSERGTAGAVGA